MGKNIYQETYKRRVNKRCLDCGNLICPQSIRCIHCSSTLLGKDHNSWKDGKAIQHHGYIYIKMHGDPRANSENYVAEHRIVWEETNGVLPKGWIIHHLNGDKHDNRLENLKAMPRNKHNGKECLIELRARVKELESRVTLLEAENVLLRKERESVI